VSVDYDSDCLAPAFDHEFSLLILLARDLTAYVKAILLHCCFIECSLVLLVERSA
jgi:hypothetical protein